MQTCVGACMPVWSLAAREAVQVVGKGGVVVVVVGGGGGDACEPNNKSSILHT